MKNNENYLLIDVMNLVHRVYSSVSKFQNIDTDEKQINSIDLYVHTILKNVVKNKDILGKNIDIPNNNVIMAFDSHSWRRDFLSSQDNIDMKSEDYKGGRNTNKMHIIKLIVKRLEEVCNNIDFKIIREDEYEADDLIALFVKKDSSINPDNNYCLISNDKDFYQLLTEEHKNFKIHNPTKGKNDEKFVNTNGKTSLLIKTLEGDKSDAIESPFFPLNLDDEVVKTTYGIKTILNRLNGHFKCVCDNGATIKIKQENGELTIIKEGSEEEILYHSLKTKIKFTKNYYLENDIKLSPNKDKTDIENGKDEELVKYLIDLTSSKEKNSFILDEDHLEIFINTTITELISKYKKELQKYYKIKFLEKDKKELKETFDSNWVSDLINFNPTFFDLELKNQNESDIINKISEKFIENLKINNKLIDFNEIPSELVDKFNNEFYSYLINEEENYNNSKYLKDQGFIKLSEDFEYIEKKSSSLKKL